MKYHIFVLLAFIATTMLFTTHMPIKEAQATTKCRVNGLNWKGSHPTLKQGLCDLSRALDPVIIANSKAHQNCRTRVDKKGKPNSWHKYHKGCRAADVRIKGASLHKIKRWWLSYTTKKPYLGGASVYNSGFVHVDTRTEGARSW